MKTFITAVVLATVTISAQASYSPEVFQKVITSVGDQCGRVTEVFYSGSHKSEKMYSIACTGGRSYMVKDGRQGTTVVPCSTMAAIGLRCFVKF
jgi:hypothetical protein